MFTFVRGPKTGIKEVVSRFEMVFRLPYVCVLVVVFSVCVTMALYTTPSCRHSSISGHDVLSRQLQVLVNSSLSFLLDTIVFLMVIYFLLHTSHAAVA